MIKKIIQGQIQVNFSCQVKGVCKSVKNMKIPHSLDPPPMIYKNLPCPPLGSQCAAQTAPSTSY